VAAGFRPALAVSAGLSMLGAATALAVTRRRAAPPAPRRAPDHHAPHQPAEPPPASRLTPI
jgi:hypothetical protein